MKNSPEQTQRLVKKWLEDNARRVEEGSKLPPKKRISIEEYRRRKANLPPEDFVPKEKSPPPFTIPKLQKKRVSHQEYKSPLEEVEPSKHVKDHQRKVIQRSDRAQNPPRHLQPSGRRQAIPRPQRYEPFLRHTATARREREVPSAAPLVQREIANSITITIPNGPTVINQLQHLQKLLPLGLPREEKRKGRKRGGKLVRIRQLKAVLRKLSKINK